MNDFAMYLTAAGFLAAIGVSLGLVIFFRRPPPSKASSRLEQLPPTAAPTFWQENLTGTLKTLDTSSEALLADLREKWRRPLHKLPVSVDIPRLARKITVTAANGVVAFDGGTDGLNPTDAVSGRTIHSLISAIAELSQDDPIIRDVIAQQFFSQVNEQGSGDLPGQFAAFLNNHMPEHISTTTRILKSCNQSVLAAAILRLKVAIATFVPFKDLRGQWHIDIQFQPDRSILVRHRKREQSWSSIPSEHFEFGWQLDLVLEENATEVRSATVRITDIELDDQISKEYRQKLMNAVAPYYTRP